MRTEQVKTIPSLRQHAEEKARMDGVPDSNPLSLDEAQILLHELRVHQIELEMQNNELRRSQEDLAVSESKYFDLYDLAPVGYLTTNEQGLIIEANLAAATMFGVERNYLLKKPLTQNIFPEDADYYYQLNKKLIKTGEMQNCQIRLKRADGELFWAHLQATPAQGGDCRVIINDITERKQAEIKLLESEERYRGLISNLDVGVIVHAPDSSIRMNNPRSSELLGISDDQMKGRLALDTNWNFISESEVPLPLEEYPVNRIIAGKKPIHDQILGVCRPLTNDVVWLTVNGFPVFDGKRELSEIIVSFIDITKRKQTEETLADNTNKLTEAQRIAHIGSWELDNSKSEWQWSDEVFRIYGLEISELPVNFELFLQHVHPEDRQMVHTTFTRSVTECTPYHIRHRIIRKSDNETRFVSIQCNHTCNAAGFVTTSVGTVQDITELVAKENDLKEYAHHIVKMIENERTRIARELHDELGQTLTVLSFAINQLKHDHRARKKVLLSLPDMQSGVDQMMESIRRICTALRPALLDELGLAAALEWLGKDFSRRTGLPCNVSVKGSCCSHNNADCCMAIFRIVQESLNNIMKHAVASRADISFNRCGGTIYVEISDDGRGMKTKKRSVDRSFGIIGMRERAHSLGATFEITSKKGKGTSVKLVIPCRGQEGTNAVSHC